MCVLTAAVVWPVSASMYICARVIKRRLMVFYLCVTQARPGACVCLKRVLSAEGYSC